MTTIYDLDRLHELEALCERQRSALDAILEAVGKYLKGEMTAAELHEIYMQISTYSTMTGSSEK